MGKFADNCDSADFHEFGSGAFVSLFNGTVPIWSCRRSFGRKYHAAALDDGEKDIYRENCGTGNSLFSRRRENISLYESIYGPCENISQCTAKSNPGGGWDG